MTKAAPSSVQATPINLEFTYLIFSSYNKKMELF